MHRTLTIATASCALLTACGGGDTSTGTSSSSVTSPSVSYQSLSSTAAATSALAGAAIRSNGSTGTLDVVTIANSSLTHNTGAATVNDGTYSLTDADGFDANGRLSDGSSTLSPAAGFSGRYEYVTPYSQSYSAGGTSYTVPLGVVGVATAAADVSTSGSATYTGEAAGVVASGTTSYDLTGGTATVTANFGSGRVNVTTTGFTATQTGGTASAVPVDTVSVANMSIAGNTFSGGTVTTLNGGAVVNVTGPNTTTAAGGAFFGFDATNNFPDEVGGVIAQQGDNGLLGVGFVGD
ncbi:MAG: hypothetical protein AAF092_11215 [Pseudomonadota bacterium]